MGKRGGGIWETRKTYQHGQRVRVKRVLVGGRVPPYLPPQLFAFPEHELQHAGSFAVRPVTRNLHRAR